MNAPTLHQSIDERLEALQFLMAENQEKELILHGSFIRLNDGIKSSQ
jgi:hypothetical protein